MATKVFDGRVCSYMVRTGGGNADVAPEGTVKPEASIVYTPKDIEAVTVAEWTKVNRQDLDDVDGLASDLQNVLTYDVRAKVEELLATAIISTSGIGAPDVAADGNTVDKLITATMLLLASGVVPNFIAMAPGRGRHLEGEGANARRLPRRLALGPPAPGRPDPALAPGKAMIGDSRVAASLGVRQGITVHVSTADQDDLVRNRVTTLLEGRWAPAVTTPGAISLVDLA